MTPLSPTQVLEQVAAALPQACRDNVIACVRRGLSSESPVLQRRSRELLALLPQA